MKVSFDFDGCANTKQVLAIMRAHLAGGSELYILTYRHRTFEDNTDVMELAELLNIPTDHVLFAAETSKVKLAKEHGIEVHYDDDLLEVHNINTADFGCMAVCVHYTNGRSNLYDYTGLDEDITLLKD